MNSEYGTEQSVEITDYPLVENYTVGRDYIYKKFDWKGISEDVRKYGFVQFDVSSAIDIYDHLSLDDEYRLICYVTREYHGLWGRVAAVKKGEHDKATAVEGALSGLFHGPELVLPDGAAPPMEAIYHDGWAHGYLDTVLCNQLLTSLPYAQFEHNQWEELIDERPQDMRENWNEWVHIPDWHIRAIPSGNEIGYILAFRRHFENGFGSSDGIDRIYLDSYSECAALDLYNHFSETKQRTTMYKTHISGRDRYSEHRRCCVFGHNEVEVACQRND